MLPRRDGLDVCREIRRSDIRTPIIVLTARDALEDKVMGLDSGADDYVTKPYELEELLARVRSLLRRARPAVAEPLEAAGLVLDGNAREVRCEGSGTAAAVTMPANTSSSAARKATYHRVRRTRIVSPMPSLTPKAGNRSRARFRSAAGSLLPPAYAGAGE